MKSKRVCLHIALRLYPPSPAWIHQNHSRRDDRPSHGANEISKTFLTSVRDFVFQKTGNLCPIHVIEYRCCESYAKNLSGNKSRSVLPVLYLIDIHR